MLRSILRRGDAGVLPRRRCDPDDNRTFGDFLSWAWARHHNILSRYIRSLSVVPLAYFAYERSPSGITLTFEKEWLTGA
jgi:hypothetical protein